MYAYLDSLKEIIHLLFDPFVFYGFMRRALVACFALSLSSTPLGVFLLLRRMTLIGDALSHAILPGVAIGYLISGMSIIIIGISGFIAGLIVAVLSSLISSMTFLKEDASFTGFYLGSLSLGVILVSLYASDIDLLHFLFGSILSIDIFAIKFIGIIASFTFIILAFFYRALVIEVFDITFLRVNSNKTFPYLIQVLFLSLVVINLVAGFQILGTLMSVGLMMMPSVVASFWTYKLPYILLLAIVISLFCSWIGLLASFYASLPAGPSIILCISILFFISLISSILGSRNRKIIEFYFHKKIIKFIKKNNK